MLPLLFREIFMFGVSFRCDFVQRRNERAFSALHYSVIGLLKTIKFFKKQGVNHPIFSVISREHKKAEKFFENWVRTGLIFWQG